MSSIETHKISRPAFLLYLRTGLLPDPQGLARKYNHNHDPENGQFTFAPGGSSVRIAPARLRELAPKPVPPPRAQFAAGGSGGRSEENRLIGNMRGETNSFLMEAANARIRAIAPTSPALQQLRAPDVEPASSVVRQQVETAEYLEGAHRVLKPNGANWLGREFTSPRNRNVYGGAAEFNRLADSLTRGTTLDPNSPGSRMRFSTPGGGHIILRTRDAVSTPGIYGTIDVNIPTMTHRHFAIKVHK
jgi:hypothetical protein